MNKNYVQIFITTESRSEADKLTEMLLRKHLAGCIQIIGPIFSRYQWKGRRENVREWLCLIKSRADLFEELTAVVKKIHKYEVPEIIAVPITKSSKNYINWLEAELKKAKK